MSHKANKMKIEFSISAGITMSWCVLRLREEEVAFKYG
jgi:hypothetical protein